jgi:hypothetical protein
MLRCAVLCCAVRAPPFEQAVFVVQEVRAFEFWSRSPVWFTRCRSPSAFLMDLIKKAAAKYHALDGA